MNFVFEQCVHVFCNVYKSWQTEFYFLYIRGYCILRRIMLFTILIKRAGKTPAFERPINVSNEKRRELRFCSKSIYSMKSCVWNFGSLKIHLFSQWAPDERCYKLWLKSQFIPLACLTCKIISVLYSWHFKAGKVYKLKWFGYFSQRFLIP